MNTVEEIKSKIERFTKLLNDERSTAEEKERYKKGIEKLEKMLSKDDMKTKKPKTEKTESKKEEEKPEPKKKGVKVHPSKKVVVDGKEMTLDSKEFCEHLTAKFEERRAKALANKGKKKKTVSVMSRISTNIEKGVLDAIKVGVKENEDSLKKDPKKFIAKVEKLETATKSYMQSLKDVLGDEFDIKEVTETTKAIEDMISELKKKYSK